MNTACWRRAIAMSRCTTSSPPGTHAGWLLHREAGGYAARFDGSPYKPTHRSGGLLYAPDAGSWHAAQKALMGEDFVASKAEPGRGPSPSGVPFSGTPPRVIPRSYPHYLWTTLWKAL